MQTLLSDQVRLVILILLCSLLWSLESIIPLYRFRNRMRHALPNVALTLMLVLTNVALSFVSAYLADFTVHTGFGLFNHLELSVWTQAIFGVMSLDLFAYFSHVLLHKSPLGWQFHRVHHSENEVDVTTAFRQHPGETVWRILWQLAAIAIFGIPVQILAIYLALSAINAQLEHANIKLNSSVDRLLRLVVVTPNMHKIHHSRDQRETDSNYANIFALWDRLFGTYTPTGNFQTLRYGLDGFDVRERQVLIGLLKMPFMGY